MAEANGNMTQDTTLDDVQVQQATMKVYGTNEPYMGLMVTIAGFEYTTVGGALEGDSVQLVPIDGSEMNPSIIEQTPIGFAANNLSQPNNNPVTSTFNSTVVYYRAVSGNGVPIGTIVHRHEDGTIMLGNPNSPNYDMNNPDNVLSLTPVLNIMSGGIGPGGVNPNQDQQNQLMGGGRGGQAGVNPNQDMDNLY